MDTLTPDFDAIVIGSGISGGWAAKEFCERGFKTLVLERGRQVTHVEDYPTAQTHPWEMDYHGRITQKEREDNPIVSKCYAYGRATEHFFVKDHEHPYQQDKPFDWIRAYQVGGKSLLWARQVQRWSRYEFERPYRDGYGIQWPIDYRDLAPWYSHVERFIGVSGNKDGLEEVPDGEFLPAWEMNAIEEHIQTQINAHYTDRTAVIGRCAHLTKTTDLHRQQALVNIVLAQARADGIFLEEIHRGGQGAGANQQRQVVGLIGRHAGDAELAAESGLDYRRRNHAFLDIGFGASDQFTVFIAYCHRTCLGLYQQDRHAPANIGAGDFVDAPCTHGIHRQVYLGQAGLRIESGLGVGDILAADDDLPFDQQRQAIGIVVFKRGPRHGPWFGDEVKLQRRHGADQVLRAGGVLDARQLDDNAVGAHRRHVRLLHTELVDT